MKQEQSRLANSQIYTPYGLLHPKTAASSLGFNGQRKAPVTDGYPLGNGYRIYSPSLMRFHSPDWLSPFGAGGNNSYAYCENDPLNHVDPSGQAKFVVRSGSRYQTKFSLPVRNPNSIFDLPSKLHSTKKAYQKQSNNPFLVELLATDQRRAKHALKHMRQRIERMHLELDEMDARINSAFKIVEAPADAPSSPQVPPSHQSPTIISSQTSQDVNIRPNQGIWLDNFRTAVRNGDAYKIFLLARQKLQM